MLLIYIEPKKGSDLDNHYPSALINIHFKHFRFPGPLTSDHAAFPRLAAPSVFSVLQIFANPCIVGLLSHLQISEVTIIVVSLFL